MAKQNLWQIFHRRPLVAIANDAEAFFAASAATSAPAGATIHPAAAAWAAQHPGKPVPLIVQHTGAADDIEAFIRGSGGTVEREFHIIPALDISLPSDRLAQLAARADVNWIGLDVPVALAPDKAASPPDARQLSIALAKAA